MQKKACFGVLDTVFPLGEGGLREVPEGCRSCEERVACLKTALETREGLEMRSRLLDRASESGLRGRIQRWSRKKTLSRRISREKKRNV